MKTWTALTAPHRAPVLVPEGFAWGGLFLGPLWLASVRAWNPALVALAVYIVLATLAPGWTLLAAAVLIGLFGHDLHRMALEQRGYALVHVIAASSADSALARLLARRPDLIADAVMADLPA